MLTYQGHSNLLTLRLGGNIESAASFGLHEDIARFRKGKCLPKNILMSNSDVCFRLTRTAQFCTGDVDSRVDIRYFRWTIGYYWRIDEKCHEDTGRFTEEYG